MTTRSFDRQAVLDMADKLYAKSSRLPRVYGAMGFFIGLLLGWGRNPFEESVWWWGVPLVVGVLCGAIGRMRGQMMCFDLRFRAETALCQLEIADKMVDSNSENSGS